MNRRAFLVGPALAAAIPGDAAVGRAARDVAPDRIRQRIALICDAFARDTVAFPDPMPPAEALAIQSLSDAELETPEHILRFALKWGVNLDWLICGDVRALIHDARMGRLRVIQGGKACAKK